MRGKAIMHDNKAVRVIGQGGFVFGAPGMGDS
jgi:hypothetical protein